MTTLAQVATETCTTRFLTRAGRKLKMKLRLHRESEEMCEAHATLIRALGDDDFVRQYLDGVRRLSRGSLESNGLAIAWKRPKRDPGLLNLTIAEMT